jgi:ABC-type dipeptide/oligopeptide/nickel transport system permease subunit
MSVDAPAMPAVVATSEDERAPAPRHRRVVRSPLLVIGLVLVGLAALAALFAPVLSPYNPHVVSGPRLQQPSGQHWLGTDVPGRDILSQLLYGAWPSLEAGAVAGSLTMLGAILFGVLPALRRGLVDDASNRMLVFLLALPGLPLLIAVGALAQNNELALVLVIALLGVAPNARILRSQALALRDRGFIGASRGFGGSPLYVLRRHVVPAMGPLVAIGFVNWAGTAVALQAGLAFLGLGNPSQVSWGSMMERALSQPSLYSSPMWKWWVLPPGIAITLTLIGFTFVGVGLEPSFNPRWMRSS